MADIVIQGIYGFAINSKDHYDKEEEEMHVKTKITFWADDTPAGIVDEMIAAAHNGEIVKVTFSK